MKILKSLFSKKDSKKEGTGIYVVQLKKDFKSQFPMNLNKYIQVNTIRKGNYVLTNELYQGNSFGYKVLFTKEEALSIVSKLYALPLIAKEIEEKELEEHNVSTNYRRKVFR